MKTFGGPDTLFTLLSGDSLAFIGIKGVGTGNGLFKHNLNSVGGSLIS